MTRLSQTKTSPFDFQLPNYKITQFSISPSIGTNGNSTGANQISIGTTASSIGTNDLSIGTKASRQTDYPNVFNACAEYIGMKRVFAGRGWSPKF
jgi:hypothetical protein